MPEFVTVIVFTVDVPVLTLPKASDAGETVIAGFDAAIPVPLAVMTAGELLALLAIEIVAESAAAVCGANVMVATALAPAAMVDPLAMPLTE